MALFGMGPSGPTKINRVQINQSVLGYAIPVVMGKGRIQQTLLWVDGFSSVKYNPATGKGIGGGKGGTEYIYSADIIAALCNGGGYILGIGDIWSGQSWLSTTATEETYIITGGTPIYTPLNAANLVGDHGVSTDIGYSATFGDVGSGTGTSLSGTQRVPLRRIVYGVTPDSGEYSIDNTGKYYFSPVDAGRSVQLSYSFSLQTIKQQNVALIPSGRTVQVASNTQPFVSDGGVVYALGPNEGKALIRVGSPSAAGQYSVSGNAPATYTFSAADINQEVRITALLDDRQSLPVGPHTYINFTLFEGEKHQQPWALLQSSFPDAAIGYSGICYVAYSPMELGFSAQLQQNTFEVLTSDAWGGGIVDCSPVQCILRVLTDPVWGLGKGPVSFPASAIDNGPTGTWGTPSVQGNIRQESTAVAWFAANGYFITAVLDKQDSAASVISRWLEAGQCAAFMSEGLMKLVPYGDTSTAGNGVVWVAPQQLAADLDDTDFLIESGGNDPVTLSSSPWPDAYNHVQANWNNRAQQYAPELTYESDQSAINRFGERIEDPQGWDFITTLPSAVFAASMRLKRNVYTRNSYGFKLSQRYCHLEPMDIVRITTSSSWSQDNRLGIAGLLIRITKVVDHPDGTLDIEAEDYVFGANQPSIYNKSSSGGSLISNAFANPGSSEVVLFEPPGALTGFPGNQIWMGACGLTPDWGNCRVYASMDGSTYKFLDTITTPARLGSLLTALPSGSDPDTSDTLVVALAGSTVLDGGTTADADSDNTLSYVDGELVSYSTCTITGPNQFTMGGYLRRGRRGSSVSAHAAGSLFLRLDEAILKYTYDPSWIGKTIYLKFQAVNAYGNSPQDLSLITPLAYTILGNNRGTIGSGDLPPNVPNNTANNATIIATAFDSSTGTYTLEIFGPGGVGTSWTHWQGSVTRTFAAGSIIGVPASTVLDTKFVTVTVNSLDFGSYSWFISLTQALADSFIIVGTIQMPT